MHRKSQYPYHSAFMDCGPGGSLTICTAMPTNASRQYLVRAHHVLSRSAQITRNQRCCLLTPNHHHLGFSNKRVSPRRALNTQATSLSTSSSNMSGRGKGGKGLGKCVSVSRWSQLAMASCPFLFVDSVGMRLTWTW